MNRNESIKFALILPYILSFTFFINGTKLKGQAYKSHTSDTIIVKLKHELIKSYEVSLYSKAYSYCWLVGNDTLDFIVSATEYKKDSTVHISVHHKKPILFTNALAKINECLTSIEEDFDLYKLNSLYFEKPIYYLGLVRDIATEYEKQFGRKGVSYDKLNLFLLNSKLNKQLVNFTSPFGKRVKRYSIEKFNLIHKKYYSLSLPNVDFTEYPEFTIDGFGLYVQLENRRK